jgi:hypothetical protein
MPLLIFTFVCLFVCLFVYYINPRIDHPTGVEPDVFTSAKALGAGVPIGAMMCKVMTLSW